NADMQFMHAAPEPDTPAFCQIVGLRNFLHPQNFYEKPAGLLFTALRRGQLDVINARKLKCHGILIPRIGYPDHAATGCGTRHKRTIPQTRMRHGSEAGMPRQPSPSMGEGRIPPRKEMLRFRFNPSPSWPPTSAGKSGQKRQRPKKEW